MKGRKWRACSGYVSCQDTVSGVVKQPTPLGTPGLSPLAVGDLGPWGPEAGRLPDHALPGPGLGAPSGCGGRGRREGRREGARAEGHRAGGWRGGRASGTPGVGTAPSRDSSPDWAHLGDPPADLQPPGGVQIRCWVAWVLSRGVLLLGEWRRGQRSWSQRSGLPSVWRL